MSSVRGTIIISIEESQPFVFPMENRKNDLFQCSFSVQSLKKNETKITYRSQFVLMSRPRHFVFMFCETASLVLF